MRQLVILFLVMPILFWGCSGTSSANDFKVKGLYIGMDMDDACKIVNQLVNSTEVSKVAFEPGSHASQAGYLCQYPQNSRSNPQIYVISNLVNKVTAIVISSELTPTLFNANGIEAEDFAKQFMDSYHLPKMDPWTNDMTDTYSMALVGLYGWEYVSPNGFKVAVSQSKGIMITAIPKKSDESFN